MNELIAILSQLLRESGRKDFQDHVDDPMIAPNELLFDDGRRVLAEEAPEPPPMRPQAQMGVNPVTISPKRPEDPYLVLARVHIGAPGGRSIKTVTAMMHVGDRPLDETMLAFAIFDEDHLVDGLLHLFPRGELEPATVVARGWPRPRPTWETSDGRTWPTPDEARDHQAEVNKAADDVRIFRPWYVIDYGHEVAVGCATSPDDLESIRRAMAVSCSTTVHTGFHSKEEANAFAERRRDKHG
jgi:hypothetical protein